MYEYIKLTVGTRNTDESRFTYTDTIDIITRFIISTFALKTTVDTIHSVGTLFEAFGTSPAGETDAIS